MEVHGRTGETVIEMPIGRVSREYGANSYEMNRLRLTQTLARMVGSDLHRGHVCTGVETVGDRAVASFSDGTTDEGDIIIGCDGAGSVVRESIHSDVKLEMLNSGGWIAVIDKHPPGLLPNRHIDFWQAGVKAGVSDIGHGEARWYVAMADRVADDSRSKKAQILETMPILPPILRECMDMTDESDMVQTQAGDLLALSPWYQGRVLLVGDAAHATSPYAGMGACTAIADAKLIADMIACCTDIPIMFQAFQDRRKPIADEVIKESRKSLSLSTSRSKLKNWLRDLVFSHIPDATMHKVVSEMVTGK